MTMLDIIYLEIVTLDINGGKMKYDKGSITVEASIVMPIFISVIVAIIMLMRIFLIQLYVDDLTSKTARFLSIYSFVDFNINEKVKFDEINKDASLGKIVENISKAYAINIGEDTMVMGALSLCGFNSEFIDTYNISNIDIDGSGLIGDEEDIYVIVKYDVPLNLPIIPIKSVERESRAVLRSWRNKYEKTYWISDRGSKYHIYGCYHIFKDIEEVNLSDINKLEPCNTCKPFNEHSQKNYRSSTGTKYHIKGCIHLFKNLREISLVEAKNNYEPCKTCIGGGL